MTDCIQVLSGQAAKALSAANYHLVTAESCTGGWIAKAMTDMPGSSQWFERGFVTYSNQAKVEELQVTPQLINNNGAVSEAVVQAMALGALQNSSADVAVAVSGIAGPDGGTGEKPVGTVWFAWALRSSLKVVTARQLFVGNRDQVRRAAVEAALTGIINLCKGENDE